MLPRPGHLHRERTSCGTREDHGPPRWNPDGVRPGEAQAQGDSPQRGGAMIPAPPQDGPTPRPGKARRVRGSRGPVAPRRRAAVSTDPSAKQGAGTAEMDKGLPEERDKPFTTPCCCCLQQGEEKANKSFIKPSLGQRHF